MVRLEGGSRGILGGEAREGGVRSLASRLSLLQREGPQA